MELDNGVIFGAVQALNELFQKEWPVKASLALAKLLKILNGPFEPIENVRNGLVQKHVSSPVALLDDAGERVSRGPDQMTPEHPNWEAFAVDFNELMVDTSEVEDFEKVILPLVVDDKEVVVKPTIITALEKFVEFK